MLITGLRQIRTTPPDSRHGSSPAHTQTHNFFPPALLPQVLLMWPVIALMLLSVIFKITATFHPQFMSNPDLYFPLIVTLEALSALCLTLGHFFAQVGLGGRLAEYQAGQLPWQLEQQAGAKAGDAEQGLPQIVARAP